MSANKHWLLQQFFLQHFLLTCRLALPIVLGYFIDWFSDPLRKVFKLMLTSDWLIAPSAMVSLETHLSEDLPKIMIPEVDGYIWAGLFSFISFAFGMTMSPHFHLQMVQGPGYSLKSKPKVVRNDRQ